MPQFPMTDSRKRILEKIPDYAVEIEPAGKRVVVRLNGEILADSGAALLVLETRHNDVFYLPRDDVKMDRFTATDLSTYCPFKGHANYWSVDGGPDDVVWSYESPYPEVEALKDYVSFYTDKVEVSAE